jgi:NADH:ubiquinone oxidoreductase subunit K
VIEKLTKKFHNRSRYRSQFFILIEIPINDRDRAIGIGIVIGKYRDDDNPARATVLSIPI